MIDRLVFTHQDATVLLEQLLPEPPDRVLSRNLPALARAIAAHVDVAPLPVATGERRWLRLDVTAEYDAWLITWGAGSGLELHDHGGSSGVLHVVRGSLVERARDRGATMPLVTRRLRAHDTVVVPASREHEVSNPHPTVAVSVHVYTPPLTFGPGNPA